MSRGEAARSSGRPGQRIGQARSRIRERRDDVMRVALFAQLLQCRERQGVVVVEPPFEALPLLHDDTYRALDIGRGLLDGVIDKAFRERLPGFPDPRHAAILWMQRAQMQVGAVERHAMPQDLLAKPREQLGVVGGEAALADQPIANLADKVRVSGGRT